jgi:hypothetical protein
MFSPRLFRRVRRASAVAFLLRRARFCAPERASRALPRADKFSVTLLKKR